MISSRQLLRFFIIFTGSLSLFLSSFPSSSFAKIQQWDFQDENQYRFDSQKIQVKNGIARLASSEPFRDSDPADFNKGNFDLNTTAERGSVELTSQNLYETPGVEIPVPVSAAQPGMVALWNFDEPGGTNVLDEASRTVAKTSDTEIVSSQTGFGFSRAFDGEKSYLFIPHYQTFKFDRALTFEMWIRPQVTVGLKPQTLISKWQQAGSQKSFAFQINPEGKLDFVLSADGATSRHHVGSTILSGGVWYHVAAVFDGQEVRLYLNGVLDAQPVPFQDPIYSSSNPIYIGSLINNKLDEFFKGVLDNVALYNRALTEDELLNHAGNARALAGLWHFNDRGEPAQDATGFGQQAMGVQKPEFEAEGKIGKGIHLDGKKQYFETPASSRFAANGALTLQAWVKPDKNSRSSQISTILSSLPEDPTAGRTNQGEYSLFLTGADGTLGAVASGISPAEIRGRTPLMPDVWSHVAVTWAAGRVHLYVNGVLDASASYRGFLRTGRSGLRIGMDAKNLAPFSGNIDEAAVYRRARTALEISADAGGINASGIYTSGVKDASTDSVWRSFSWKEALGYLKGLSNTETGLLHLYHLDETERSVFTDVKGDNQASAVGTYSVGGMFGRARWFKSKGLDKIISQKNFPALSTFTASLWFEFSSAQPGVSDRLFSIGDANLTVYRGEDGRIHVGMLGAREIVSHSLIQDTAWHHLAVAADGRNLFLYIDGQLEGNSPFMSATAEAPLVLGNLKSFDTFQGAMDEFSFFNAPLSRTAIYEQYLKGKLKLIFQVRSSNDPSFSGVLWRDLDGSRRAALETEASTVGLWHFEESALAGRPQEVTDASRFANHGMTYGRVNLLASEVSGKSAEFNGSSDYIQIPDSESLHLSTLTISAWIKPAQIQEQDAVILDKQFEKGSPAFSSYALELTAGNRLNLRLGYNGGYSQFQTEQAGEITVGKWNHVAAVYDGKEVRLYINGELKKRASFQESLVYDKGSLFFGRYGAASSRYFSGSLDEVLIDSKPRETQEIVLQYHSLRPRFVPVTEGKLEVDRGRYFQYRAFLGSDTANAGPQFRDVEVLSNLFSTDRPSISNQNTISYAFLSHFSEKLGTGNRGAVSYQLSNDGANWFYHNGRRWVIANGYSESNTADQIQSRIQDFSKEVGIGSFFFKAFLHSPTGLEPAELQNVEVEYLPNKVTVTSPNGGEAWVAGSEHAISWTTSGDLKQVNLEYSKDDFKSDFHLITKNWPNSGSYTWKVPNDLATQVKVRVIDGLEPRVYDVSDLSFRIAGELKVLSPNYNERWQVGTEQEIKWETTGKIENVKIDFSTDDFTKAVYPVVDSVRNENKFLWKVTDPISSAVKIRVSDVRDPLTFDKSNDSFAIHGKIDLLSPSAGSRWIVGSAQTIRWENAGAISAVRVEYQGAKKDGWIVIADKVANDKSISWTVPDDIDPKVIIRVTDVGDAKVSVTSPEFAIIGGLRLTHPGGGENWTVGSRRKIAWQTIGTIPLVNLEYKLSSAEEWLPIAKSAANTGSYVWDIPEQPADLVAVRVSDPNDQEVQADNAVPSRIIPAFVLKSPNGGEDLKIGSEADIVWDTKGKVDKVRLEYSRDQFVKDVRLIIGAASNIGRFSWKVPDDAGTKMKVRISASNLPAAHDISDSDFRIYPEFQFTAPQGGEKYEVGSLATLTWKTTGTVPEVRLEYSHDDFTKDVRTIAQSLKNEDRYTWTVPDDIGAGYALRISDVRDSKAQNFSQGFFSVIGKFRILEPVGGESYTAGVITPIKWKGAGSVPFVRIDISEDGFEKSFQTIAEQAPNTGSYDWQVPNLIGHEFRIRIWDPSHPDAQDIMEKPARIIGGFRLLAPNGGEVLYVGDQADIKWEVLGTVPTVKIEYSDDHFQHRVGEIADAYENTGLYRWQIPDLPTGQYSLRISDPRDAQAFDLSNSEFKIRSRFTLTSPNGGEGWAVGEKKAITWQTTGSVPEVRLEYSIDDFSTVKTIAEKAPNTGSYEWLVPDHVSQNVRVRISDVKDFEALDLSDGAFRIQGVIQLDSPAPGDLLRVGEQRVIHWTNAGRIEGVRLDYSHDNFSSEVITIVDSIPNTGSYNWTVPDDISPNTKIRVSDLKDIRTQSISAEPFQIAASFQILGPNGGERWHASEKREIVWATVGTVKEVNLEYSKDDFKTDPEVIDRGVLNTGKFTWELPRDLGENFKVRVCDADHPRICDASDKSFSLEPPFEFTYPKTAFRWQVGSSQELRWNAYGYVPRVTLQYAVQEPPAEWKTLSAELPNEGHFFFKVPDDISKTVRFRVSDFEDGDVAAVTSVPVEFIGTFQLLTPNGGEKWLAGTKTKITWKTLGTAPQVRLEYSDDDFNRSVNLIEASLNNSGAYEWTVPESLMPAAKVRISDASNSASFDVSDAGFKILPHFTLTSPNGNERWVTGDKVQIQWKTEGMVPRVRLEIGTRSEDAKDYVWKALANVRGALHIYDWTVPAEVSSDVKVRVFDERDLETIDESDSPFKILARFKSLAPRADEILTVSQKYAIKWVTEGSVPSVKLEYAVLSGEQGKSKEPEFKLIEKVWQNSGVYYWTVPDTAGEKITLRVSDAREPEAYVLGEPFRIRGALKLNLPDEDLKWPVGSQQTLRWNTTGTIDRVKLEYSTDSRNWKLIEESLPNSGSYGWLVPDALSQTVALRVSDVTNPAIFSESERPLTIMGEFQFLNPAEPGVKWQVGSRQKISWKTAGSVKRVWLDYSTGDKWMTIAGPLSNEGVYEWTVPDSISSGVRLRVKDPDNPAAQKISESFQIHGALEVTSPAGGEVWETASQQTILWNTTGTIPFVRIEGYWQENKAATPAAPQAVVFGPQLPVQMQAEMISQSEPWFVISEREENRGRYQWTVPDKIGNELKVRISDAADNNVSAVSEKPFSIIAALKVLNPKGGENWTVGDQQQIVWSSQGTLPEVLLEYSRDDFYRDVNVIASGVANTGGALWTVPDSISDQVKIRVTDSRDKRAFQLSQPFRIQGALGFITPHADEILKVASKEILHWKTTGSIPRVRLEYSRDDFRRDVQVIENDLENSDTYTWTVPDIVSSTVKLRVSDLRDKNVTALSSVFKVEPVLQLQSPVGRERLQALSPYKILWNTTGTVSKVRLEYSFDDFKQDIRLIKTDEPNHGVFEWRVPEDFAPAAKVRVSDSSNFSVSSVSPEPFELHGSFSFTTATEGMRWPVSSAQKLSWQTVGSIPQIRLEYSKDDFQKDIHLIAEGIANQNQFEWTIPDDISDNIRLRLMDPRDASVFAVTSAPAAIVGQVKVVSPAKDSVLTVAQEFAIQWKTVGTVPGVRIEYQTLQSEEDLRTDAWKLITGLAENSGEYRWRVPNDISLKTRIRVSDARDLSTKDTSSEFPIIGKVSFIAPSGGERWIVGSEHELLWQSTGTVPDVSLYYSTDGFVKDKKLIAEKISNSGRLLWKVPDQISSSVQLKMEDPRMPQLVSSVTAPISIAGGFVVSGLKDSVWKVGDEVRLEWQTLGTVPEVRLDYLSSEPNRYRIAFNEFIKTLSTGLISESYEAAPGTAAVQQIRILQDKIPNSGFYVFHVPDWISESGRFRISDARDLNTQEYFGSVAIQGNLIFRSPAGPQTWKVGESKTIEWETLGTISNVDIEYSTDRFQRDVQLVSKLEKNTNRYLWTVPDAAGSVFLRIQDSANKEAQAVSLPITVKPTLSLLKPAHLDSLQVGQFAEIRWKSVGTVPQVRLEYFKRGEDKEFHLIESKLETSRLQESSGTAVYRWQVPDFIADDVRIRVSDPRYLDVFSDSDLFKIKGRLEMTSPQQGEILKVGQVFPVTWNSVGTLPAVRLEVSRDGFKKDVQLLGSQLENKGTYLWKVTDVVSEHVWLRVSDDRDASVFAQNTKPIQVEGALHWVRPIGGEIWTVGNRVTLDWKTTGTVPEVKLTYTPVVQGNSSEASGAVVIADRVPNQGNYVWQIPDNVPPQIQMTVSNSSNPRVSSETRVPVKMTGVIKINSPSSKTIWPVGSTQQILWASQGYIPQIKIEGSRDGFQKDSVVLFPLLPNAGSVKWVVGDLIGKNFQIKISDVQNPDVFALTPSPIEIFGGFHVLTPGPGAVLEVGAKEEISWQTTGTIPEVRLDYSSDRFNHPIVIAERIPNTGRFSWTVPDTIEDRFQIRVSDIQHPEMAGLSDVPFSIQGRLYLKSPKGGEIWKVGSDVPLRWESIGTLSAVTLEYSTDDFASALPIAENIANRGEFTWRVPDVVSEKVKVRVRDIKNRAVYSASVNPVKIQGDLELLAPQSGEFWESGTQHSLIWKTVGSVPYVTIEYSTDNFANAVPMILGLANEGRYQWTVPDLNSETCKFRVTDAHDRSVFAVSQAIEIGGSLKLQAPLGGETWFVGEDASIEWKTRGTIPRVKIEISSDRFLTDVRVIEDSAENKGIYVWKVPDQLGVEYQIRITDAKNRRIFDTTPGVFKVAGAFSVTAPKGGEKWEVGSTQNIEWTHRGSMPSVRIEYSTDNFVTAVPITTQTQNMGRFSWEVPDLAGEKVLFRISDSSDPLISASTIKAVEVKPVLELLTPRGGEIWKARDAQTITWRTAGTLPNVNLLYSTDDFTETREIASGVSNTGSFLWTVPDLSTKNLRLRISDSASSEVAAENKVPLQVIGGLQISSPAPGEIWIVGTRHEVKWTAVGQIAKVRLEYSSDGFRTVYPIAINYPNSGRYELIVPDVISKEGMIRVMNEADPAVFAQMAKPFEIRGALNLLSPNGGEAWTIGSRHPISWQTTGTIPQVRLEYSADDFVSDIQPIVPVLDNKGVYYWEVPSISASGIKVRVLDPANENVFDISKANTPVQGELELLSPAGGESYLVGERAEIVWRATPNIANVKLEYSFDQFESSKVISDYVPNTGKFVWNMPDQISDNWQIRVSDAANQNVFSSSRLPFRTRGGLQMILPKGGEVWPAGSQQTISWNTMGAVSKVRLEYSSDNFTTAIPITAGLENKGTYLWTVPEIPHSEVRIRVAAADAPSVFSTTQMPITVVAKIEMTSPGQGERWVAGEERIIRWQTTGYLPLVDLEYSKDHFDKDIHLIAAKAPNVGSYTWHVPNDPSTEVRLRVRSSENQKIAAVSPAPFQIDFYRVRWLVRDSETNDYLSGLTMTDSTGKTVSRAGSPSSFEYPYGIYTTVWTKPGYAEHRSTWLADRDRTFEVVMQAQKEKVDLVRASFDYDREKDFMKVTVWYEKDGRPAAAVMQAEIKIYKNNEEVKVLTSSTPDAQGYFHMLWDTAGAEGNTKYFASAAVTSASGKIYTSPISYQLDIPVKEQKAFAVRHAIPSMYLKPLTSQPSPSLPKLSAPEEIPASRPRSSKPSSESAPAAADAKAQKSAVLAGETQNISSLKAEQPQDSSGKADSKSRIYETLQVLRPSEPKVQEPQLVVPQNALMQETISISYIGGAEANPVLDLYDSNHKLIVKAEPMKRTETAGTFSYLIPIRGMHFIPGKKIQVSVIDLTSGNFQSQSIEIAAAAAAMGYDKDSGMRSVLEVLQTLDSVLEVLKQVEAGKQPLEQGLKVMETKMNFIAGNLIDQAVDAKIIAKVNRISEQLAAVAQRKGYESGYLTDKPLYAHDDFTALSRKIRDIQTLLDSLQQLYQGISA